MLFRSAADTPPLPALSLVSSDETDATDAPRSHNLGNLLSRIPGRLPDAIAEYEASLRIRPDYADAHYNLGVVLSRLPDRLPEALSQLETAWRLKPNPAYCGRPSTGCERPTAKIPTDRVNSPYWWGML